MKKITIRTKENGYEPYIACGGKRFWLRRILIQRDEGFEVLCSNLFQLRSSWGEVRAPINEPFQIAAFDEDVVINAETMLGPIVLAQFDFDDPSKGGRIYTAKTAVIVLIGNERFWGGYRKMYDLVLTEDLVKMGETSVEIRKNPDLPFFSDANDTFFEETKTLEINGYTIPLKRYLSVMQHEAYLSRHIGKIVERKCNYGEGFYLYCNLLGDDWNQFVRELNASHEAMEKAYALLDHLTSENYTDFFRVD